MRSKAFLVSVVLMPIMMVGSVLLVRATKDTTDARDRTFAFIDYSGVIGEPLKAVAELYNSSSPVAAEAGLVRRGARFIPLEVKPGDRDPEKLRLELSDRVRKQELFAFAEFPASIVDPASGAAIRYFLITV